MKRAVLPAALLLLVARRPAADPRWMKAPEPRSEGALFLESTGPAPPATAASPPEAVESADPLGPDLVATPERLSDLLTDARRASREDAPGLVSQRIRPDPFLPVAAAGGLWAVRAGFARAAVSLANGNPAEARAAARGLEPRHLGLPGLGEWVEILASLPAAGAPARPLEPSPAPRLLTFAATESLEPLRRAALTAASRLVRSDVDRRAVQAAWGAWAKGAPAGFRAQAAAALAASRVADSERDALARLGPLAAAHPDAPERAPDLFDEADRRRFSAAVRSASPKVRLARASFLVSRAPDEAFDLLSHLPPAPELRVRAAEVLLLSGRLREALRALRQPQPPMPETAPPEEAKRVAALELSAEMRLYAAAGAEPPPKRKGRRARRPAPASAPSAERIAAGRSLLGRLEEMLGRDLLDVDRRRLLSEGARLAADLELYDEASRYARALVAFDPGTTVAAEKLFARAFALYRAGTPEDLKAAAHLWEEQVAVYRDVALRRRATYWAARALERAGEAPASRALLASLLPGTAADVYGRWAAAALGLSPSGPATAAAPEGDGPPPLPSDRPGLPSRELLACGFTSLAEDSAEDERTLNPVFAASLASERGDHRRAAALLKARYPELGSPEEGAVPLPARRAYYPFAHSLALTSAAAEFDVPIALLLGVVRQESLFQPSVRSRSGAVGLMQLMPATGRFLLRREHVRRRPNLADPDVNARLGARYLAQLIAQFDGEKASALAAYNAGPGRVVRWRREMSQLAPDEFLESMPMAEPRDYVKKVLFFEGAYTALYGNLPARVREAITEVPRP